MAPLLTVSPLGCLQHCPKTTELGLKTRDGEKGLETGEKNARSVSYVDSLVSLVLHQPLR